MYLSLSNVKSLKLLAFLRNIFMCKQEPTKRTLGFTMVVCNRKDNSKKYTELILIVLLSSKAMYRAHFNTLM